MGSERPPGFEGLSGFGGPPPSRRGHRAKPGGSRKRLTVIIAAIVAVVAGIAAAVVFVVLPKSTAHTTGFIPTGTTPAQDAEQITAAFLTAWKAGEFDTAARLTDHHVAAQTALVNYGKYLHLRKLSGSTQSVAAAPGTGTRQSVTFGVNVKVADSDGAQAITGNWSYHSKLVAYQKQNSNLWYIAWAPDVLAPNLTAATHLAAVRVAPQVTQVNDNGGNDITAYKDPGLTTIANLLEKQAPPGAGQSRSLRGDPDHRGQGHPEQPGRHHRAEQHQ